MKAFSRWTRTAAAVRVGGAVFGVALFGVNGAAHAADVTNPAQHPAPIKVTIDGQTYNDGLDTLPGYDDEACTPIPNVQYDFANDEIQYYDSQGELLTTAHWTEWSRISSYQTWVDQQHGGPPSSSPTPSPSATSTPAPSPSTASSPTPSPSNAGPAAGGPVTTGAAQRTRSSAPSTKSSAPKTHGSAPKTTSSGVKSPSSHDTAATTPKRDTPSHAKKRGTSTKDNPASSPTRAETGAPAGGSGTGAPVATNTLAPSPGAGAPSPSPQGTTKYKLASARTGAGASAGDTRAAGVVILAALAAVAGLAFLFGWAGRPDFARRGAFYTDKRGSK